MGNGPYPFTPLITENIVLSMGQHGLYPRNGEMLMCTKILGKTGHGDYCTLGVYLAARSSVRPCDRTRRSDCPFVRGVTHQKGGIHPLGTSTSLFLKTARPTP